MTALVLLVASIAIADSINPSTLIPAVWIASAPRGRGLAPYAFGVFAVYLVGGLVLLLGPGPALIAALHHVQGPFEHALQAAGGIVALAFAAAIWHRSRRSEPAERRPLRQRQPRTRVSAFALGAGIMAIELPTAFMYFGAISAILSSHSVVAVEIALLLAYNALFVLPILAILVARRLAGDRAERWLTSGRVWLQRAGQVALSGAAAAAGAVLVVLGVAGLLAV